MAEFADKGLLDRAVLEEIELTTNLMIAASESDDPLTRAQVDAALGLAPFNEPADD